MFEKIKAFFKKIGKPPVRKIMIVDDDIDVTEMTQMILEQTGAYEVTVSHNGYEALKLARENPPDLILLDIMMPRMDGAEMARRLREDPQLATVPVIFLTSLMTGQEAAQDSVVGGYPFISKPIRGEELLARIQEFFELED